MTASVERPQPRVSGPPAPLGRRIELPRRGTTFVREVPGPPGAPTLLLLHGWGASGGLNWFQAFEPLGAHFHVIAPDLRGHARGLRTRSVFRLADCADDCAATLVELGTGPVIAVGYSMGGPVAQLLWRRHRDLVDGLVLCATSRRASSRTGAAQLPYQVGDVRARSPRPAPRRSTVRSRALPTGARCRAAACPTWAAAEMRRHDWRMIVEAGHSISTYNARRWIGEVDVPTAVVCTTEDRGVAPDATARDRRGDPGRHRALASPTGTSPAPTRAFADPLARACLDVADRVRLTPLRVALPRPTSAHHAGRSRRAHCSRNPAPHHAAQRVGVARART